jgi:hypothetical protein
MGGGWLEQQVLFLAGGQVRMREEYADARIGVTLDPDLFRTDRWARPGWIRREAGRARDSVRAPGR